MKKLVHPKKAAGMALAAGAALLLSSCALKLDSPVAGYTCCNLRGEYGWVSSLNVQGGDFIPAGEPATFDSIKRDYYLYGTIGGIDTALRDDTSKTKEQTLEWVSRIIVSDDPNKKMATWPDDIQKAVRYGRVMNGMTREQVLMSLGYPTRIDTPDLKSDTWRYWIAQDTQPVVLHFGTDGKLAKLSGRPYSVRALEVER